MTYIGGGWQMEKSAKGLPPLQRSKISKKSTREAGLNPKCIYMALISGGMIGNSNYIGTSLNGWIQNSKQKG